MIQDFRHPSKTTPKKSLTDSRYQNPITRNFTFVGIGGTSYNASVKKKVK